MLKFISFLLIFTFTISAFADTHCTSCKKSISGQYLLSSDKKPFCSKRCFSTTLPKCSQCKKMIVGSYKTMKGNVYCSDKCFSVVLPKCNLCTSPLVKAFKVEGSHYCQKCITLDRCFSCNHPFHKGVVYKDDRKFCLTCKESAIFSEAKAEVLYKIAILAHRDLLGTPAVKVPPMKFVDSKTLRQFNEHKHDDGDGMSLRGFYQETKLERETLDGNNRVVSRSVKKTGETIYILNGLSREEIIVTAIHELTHDWLSDYYEGIKIAPLWIEEGFCQYIAYNYCLKKKYLKLAEKIKSAPDQVYGKGAKFFIREFGVDNVKGALKWLVSQKYQIKPPAGAKRRN
ncbi:MAG: LIM domain-containing protein [Lentisphaeraceae bacterium]|nr:LIM domain-containing protein [Lentisphaeraceae bacterium]